MKKLEGIEELNNILNNFLEPFECYAELDTDFGYYYASNRITYSLVVSDNMDRFFLDFAKSLNPSLTCDIFLLSLLHEIGHEETLDELDDSTIAYCQDEKTRINMQYTFAELDKDEDKMRAAANEYFNLPDEKIATEWAIDYMVNNQAEISSLWFKIAQQISKIYDMNGVKNDN